MDTTILLLRAAVSIAVASLLALVSRTVRLRRVDPSAAVANRMFAIWWYGAALILVQGALQMVAGAFGVRDPVFYTSFLYLQGLTLSVAVWGLLFYLTFLYTGRTTALVPLGVVYAVYAALNVVYYTAFGPWRVEVTRWGLDIIPARQDDLWTALLYGPLLAGPVLIATLAYASLYFRVADGQARYRIALVSASFALWFTPMLVGFLLHWERNPWFPFVYELPGVPASIMVTLAYRPPQALRRRWGKEGNGPVGVFG